MKFAETEVQLGKWSKTQHDTFLYSMGLNKAISKIVLTKIHPFDQIQSAKYSQDTVLYIKQANGVSLF